MLKIEKVHGDNFKNIPSPCGFCLYWQTNGQYDEKMLKPEMEQRKREWFSEVIKEFGNCGYVAYLSSIPIGFIQCAPAKFFPRMKEYASRPPSEDCFSCMSLHCR